MTQRDLNRAIARATGESVRDIDRLGFSELPGVPASSAFGASGASGGGGGAGGERDQPAILDWDELEAVLSGDDPDSQPCPLLLVA